MRQILIVATLLHEDFGVEVQFDAEIDISCDDWHELSFAALHVESAIHGKVFDDFMSELYNSDEWPGGAREDWTIVDWSATHLRRIFSPNFKSHRSNNGERKTT